MSLGHLLRIQKIETIDNFYVEKLFFDVLMCWIHKFQDKNFILNLLSSALEALFNISHKINMDTHTLMIKFKKGNDVK